MSGVRRHGSPQEPGAVHRRPGRDRSQREFYVAVEGEVTERDYLAFLNAEFGDRGRFFIHPITKRHGMTPLEVVQRAMEALAARHARKLVDDCPSGTCSSAGGHGASCPPLGRDPSTDVWRLLEALQVVQVG